MMPVVAQTTACFGLRPVANAFGMSVSAIATRRLRHVGKRAQPVDDAVQLRRLLRRDDPAAHAVERDLVGEAVLREQQRPTAMTMTTPTLTPAAIRIAMTATYSAPMQEHRERHPGRQAAVRAESFRYSSWDQSFVGEQRTDLGQRGVGRRQDQIGGSEVVVGDRVPSSRTRLSIAVSAAGERVVLAGVAGLLEARRRGR